MGEDTSEKCCHINSRLLPIKAHYFFYFGAMGGVIPFMPLVGKSLGISATAVGLTYTLLPLVVFLMKPVFGYITDYFRNIKLILIILLIVAVISFLLVLLINPLETNEDKNEQLECTDKTHKLKLNATFNKACLEDKLNQNMVCEINHPLCRNSTCEKMCETTMNITAKSSNISRNEIFILQIHSANISSCGCIDNVTELFKCEPSIDSCQPLHPENHQTVYLSLQFWVFTLLSIISGTMTAAIACLSDAACYEVLGERCDLYGRQRLWATVSWGITSSSTGFLNDIATKRTNYINFSPGFFLMLALVIVDIAILMKVKITKANFSNSICGDIKKIFRSYETVAFAVGTFIIGGLTGFLWQYQFWYLEELGANQALMGLTTAVQCLIAEIPFFFFSGWLIQKLGHFNCMVASFGAFALRLYLYYLLKNPWLTLPIEIMHGITYAVFYSAMTSYATDKAAPGTETTMLGVLGGLFEGLGVAAGSLLGGIGFDQIGSSNTFFVGSIISLICAPTFALTNLLIQRLPQEKKDLYEATGSSNPVFS